MKALARDCECFSEWERMFQDEKTAYAKKIKREKMRERMTSFRN